MSRWAMVLVGAWVLWNQTWLTDTKGSDQSWTPLGGFEGRRECIAEQQKHRQNAQLVPLVKGGEKAIQTIPNEFGAMNVFRDGTSTENYFICLPDTIDPRAPRAK